MSSVLPLARRLIVLAVGAGMTATALSGCASYSSGSNRSEQTYSCDDVFDSVVQRVRSDDTSGDVNGEIDWLARNCSAEYDIVTDYFSLRASQAGDHPLDDCWSLADRLSSEAIALVAEEGLCSSSWTTEDTSQPGGGIAWNDAAAHAGTTQRVCGPLAGDGVSDDDVFLNLGLDYPDPGRFQIVIWDVGGLEPISYGATLCTEGLITLYNGVPQIELEDPGRVEIYQ